MNDREIAVVREHLVASAELTRQVAERSASDVARAAVLIADVLQRGGKMMLCGNGGSAADCQHVAAECVSRLTKEFERPGIPAVALTTDTSFLTAYANDVEFDGVFARQVATLGHRGDVLVGISTSGESANIVRAAEEARTRGMAIVALCAERGRLGDMADVAIRVPGTSVQHIQESHLAIEHALVALIERRLYPREREP